LFHLHMLSTGQGNNKGSECQGLKPITVYNTNSYEKPEVIDSLDGMIDVYLPDYKYVTHEIAKEYSDASDYPVVALKTLKRIYFRKVLLCRQIRKAGRKAGC